MQVMISHDTPLPTCSAGHSARHMHDMRRIEAGGGHNIECKCSHTSRHADFDAALLEWRQTHGVAVPEASSRRRTRKAAKQKQAPSTPATSGVITSLDSMQREAMRRALAGDFELADAMELLSKGRMRAGHHHSGTWHEHDLQFGIWIGGRLQAFAYGSPLTCYDDECTDVDCACDDDADTKLVIGLDEAVLYNALDDTDIPDQFTTGRSPTWAQGVVDAYRALAAKPEQATFFSSEAA